MQFSSISYFLFLPVVFLVYYYTADRWRWLILLSASYCFYYYLNAPYLLAVLIITTGVSYTCGLQIAKNLDEQIRKRWLWIGCFANVSTLVCVKYLPFIDTSVNIILSLNYTLSVTLISIGVSYFTFQSISYLADIYLDIVEPEKHFGYFALYMAFFPKLLQGPIERAGDLLPQIRRTYRFEYNLMRSGILLFIWGLFKKLVMADRFALYSDQVYNHVHDYNGLTLLFGTYAYALQIYFDFSAYTDMARGTGLMFGISLTENFNKPYQATSIADFWRRWHISFSRWILDYIFKPLQLGWRRLGATGTAAALITTFLISGVWHGAKWGFVIWGLIHGIYLAASTYYRPYQKRLYKFLGIEKSKWIKWWQQLVTFNLVSFAWVFFRADNMSDACHVISTCFSGIKGIKSGFLYSQGKMELYFTIIAVIIFVLLKRIYIERNLINTTDNNRPLVRYLVYNITMFSIFFLANYSIKRTFVYFQF